LQLKNCLKDYIVRFNEKYSYLNDISASRCTFGQQDCVSRVLEPESCSRSSSIPGVADPDFDQTRCTLRRIALVPGQNLEMEEAARVRGQTGAGSDYAGAGMDAKFAARRLVDKTVDKLIKWGLKIVFKYISRGERDTTINAVASCQQRKVTVLRRDKPHELCRQCVVCVTHSAYLRNAAKGGRRVNPL